MNITQFSQFEDYASAVIHADIRLKLPRLVQAHWELKTTCLGQIGIQFGREGSGIIADGSAHQSGNTLFVPLAGMQFANGQALEDQRVLLMPPGGELAIASKVPHDWCSIVFPSEALGHAHQTQSPAPLTFGKSQVIDIGNQLMRQLRHLLFEINHAFNIEPTLESTFAAKESMQRELLAACKSILKAKNLTPSTMGRPTSNRRDVIQRVMTKVDNSFGENLTMDELVREAGVSERTLRGIFLEYYGLSPHRFLVVHRMHEAREALRCESPESSKVTAIAAACGFWHFGRFAREYRQIFGESPSQTLARKRSDTAVFENRPRKEKRGHSTFWSPLGRLGVE